MRAPACAVQWFLHGQSELPSEGLEKVAGKYFFLLSFFLLLLLSEFPLMFVSFLRICKEGCLRIDRGRCSTSLIIRHLHSRFPEVRHSVHRVDSRLQVRSTDPHSVGRWLRREKKKKKKKKSTRQLDSHPAWRHPGMQYPPFHKAQANKRTPPASIMDAAVRSDGGNDGR
jgi:hypothetical protein